MLVAVICTDKPGAIDVRLANRADHLDYIRTTGCVTQAGPFLDSDGGMCGSLLILDVEDFAAAQGWATNDPYAKAGLFEAVRIQHWNRVIG